MMKKLYSYEKQMADKLQQLPASDEDANWLQMKAMLDKEMPRIGAAGFGNKGGNMLMRTLVVVGIIMLGIWLLQNLNRSQNLSTTKNINTKTVTTNQQATSIDNANITTAPTAGGNNTNLSQNNSVLTEKKTASAANNSFSNTITSQTNTTSNNVVVDNVNSTAFTGNSNNGVNTTNTTPKSALQKNNNNVAVLLASTNNILNNKNAIVDDATSNKVARNKIDKIQTDFNNAQPAVVKELLPASISAVAVTNSAVVNSPADDLYKPIYLPVAKEKNIVVENSSRKERRELKRSFKGVNIKNDGTDMTFSAGLLLPGSFSIASQQKPLYNINAKSHMITDYLPAAYLQYHINERLFVNTELQFQSPQYTNRLLVSQHTQNLTPTNSLQNNVYVEKLYYFNIPLSFHYSLFNNFYIGTGIQYSSLISGVAGYEQVNINGSNSTINKYTAARFQDDSISKMLTSGDFRWQMDANYYWNRFTMGARYNRALNNVVDVQVGNTHTQARNQSLQLYIRYNIWEERKKKGYFTTGR